MIKVFRFLQFKEIYYGLFTCLLAFIPMTMAVVITEGLVDIKPYDKQLNTIVLSGNYNLRALIYYLIFGLVHIVTCVFVVYHFFLKNNRNSSVDKLNTLRKVRLIYLVFIITLVYCMDKMHVNISYLSHDRLYIIMTKSDYFKTAFRVFPGGYFSNSIDWFYTFSMFPFILIALALSVMVYGGFFIGKEMYEYINIGFREGQDIKEHIVNFNAAMKKYVQLLSLVMVSSTIATVLFFQLPVSLIKDETIKRSYMGDSISIGICWGIIFSLLLLFLCIYPFKKSHEKTQEIRRNLPIMDDSKLIKWIKKHDGFYSFMGNFQVILSIASPAIAGIITSLVSNML